MHGPDLRAALLALMRRGAESILSDDDFNALALRAFTHQFKHNSPYRLYCERRGIIPLTLERWTDIPAVPTAAFKELTLVAGDPAEARLVFKTSGTTRGSEKRGAHYVLDPSLYETSLLPTFRKFVLRDCTGMRLLSLIPPYEQAPESSLSYMISTLMRELGTSGSDFYASADSGLDTRRLNAELEAAREPVCLLGTSLAYQHWLDSLREKRFQLAAGSRLMDTGGFKGETRVVSPDDLRARYEQALGVPAADCVNEYGMTELCSQYYDTQDGIKRGPPWLRARVVDPDTLQPVARGETGIIQHFDLANLDSVCAIQTEDLGFERADGFVLLGRAPGAPPRGCSIAMDMLLSSKGA